MTAVRDPGLDGVVPFRFACQRCGHCCSGGSGYVWLEEGEIERLAAALDLSPAQFTRAHVRVARDPQSGMQRAALRETASEGGRCTLLSGQNSCSVYAARPAHCRAFPYWSSVLTDREAFESARSTCPGIAVVVDAATRARAFEALERLHADLAPEAPPASCCLDSAGSERAFATALETDYALADRPRPAGACRLGDRRPVACRAREGEVALTQVRAIERALAYPAAYGPLAEMLAARGGER